MDGRWTRPLLALACLAVATPVGAQTLVGPGTESPRHNRLRDLAARPATPVPPASPDVFGTAAVGAGVTFYDARFRRVSDADRDHPMLVEIAEAIRGLPPEQQLERVQAEVLRRVQWAHDLDTMKVADLWANAGETLERGKGDSEDIAIVAMQALKLAGWSPRDLYISVGRDRGVGAHVVLLARTPHGFMVLDDKVGRPLPPDAHSRFTPVLTLGAGKSWIHGRRVGGTSARLGAR